MQSQQVSHEVPFELVGRVLDVYARLLKAWARSLAVSRRAPPRRGLRRHEPSAMNKDELEEQLERTGGVRQLARTIGVHEATVWSWRWGKSRVHPLQAARIRSAPARPRPRPGRPSNPETLPAAEVRRLCQQLGGVRAAARAVGCAHSTMGAAATGARTISMQLAQRLRDVAAIGAQDGP